MDKLDAERAYDAWEREQEELEELRRWDARRPEVQAKVLTAYEDHVMAASGPTNFAEFREALRSAQRPALKLEISDGE